MFIFYVVCVFDYCFSSLLSFYFAFDFGTFHLRFSSESFLVQFYFDWNECFSNAFDEIDSMHIFESNRKGQKSIKKKYTSTR